MKMHLWMATCMTALIAFSGHTLLAQGNGQNRGGQGGQTAQSHTQFDDHDKQVATNWVQQHQSNPPAGLRPKDKFSPEDESKLKVNAPLDPSFRKKVHPVPRDLSRQLPPPPPDSRYVAVGGHVAQIDKNNLVQDVIHLEIKF